MEKVISCFKKNPDAVARLICFPWAGGGSIHYARWGNVLNSSTEGKTPGKYYMRGALCSVNLFCLLGIHWVSDVWKNVFVQSAH